MRFYEIFSWDFHYLAKHVTHIYVYNISFRAFKKYTIDKIPSLHLEFPPNTWPKTYISVARCRKQNGWYRNVDGSLSIKEEWQKTCHLSTHVSLQSLILFWASHVIWHGQNEMLTLFVCSASIIKKRPLLNEFFYALKDRQ